MCFFILKAKLRWGHEKVKIIPLANIAMKYNIWRNKRRIMYPIAFPILKNIANIEHAFFLEREPSGEVMTFADKSGLSWPKPVELKQVHGNRIIKIDKRPKHTLQGDGIITDTDIPISISVADCAPVYLIDAESRAVGLLHCGWKPISKNIIDKGAKLMNKFYGIQPEDLIAFIGPTILHDDYEIGDEIIHHFDVTNIVRNNGNIFLDIPGEIVSRLENLGIDPENIAYFPVSTFSDNTLTSYRREGHGVGRMVACLRLMQPAAELIEEPVAV